jgi:hypothetical protein
MIFGIRMALTRLIAPPWVCERGQAFVMLPSFHLLQPTAGIIHAGTWRAGLIMSIPGNLREWVWLPTCLGTVCLWSMFRG